MQLQVKHDLLKHAVVSNQHQVYQTCCFGALVPRSKHTIPYDPPEFQTKTTSLDGITVASADDSSDLPSAHRLRTHSYALQLEVQVKGCDSSDVGSMAPTESLSYVSRMHG